MEEDVDGKERAGVVSVVEEKRGVREWMRREGERRRGAGGGKRSTGGVVVFCAKLAALEVLRRGCQARCRLVWWAVQGLAVSGAPGLGWLRRWAPVRALADASESFSKPMMLLSLATVVASAYKEVRERKTPGVVDKEPGVYLAVVETGNSEIEEEVLVPEKQTSCVGVLREELRKHGVVLVEKLGDDMVERFWLASKGNMANFVAVMRKTLEWRQSYEFMPQSALREWSTLVFWHRRDAHGRPILIIRIGLACATLTPAQRPQFAQAVISQVEYAVQNLVTTDDPRWTVVMDCRGTTAFGFPVHMMKSCVALVQEHYPVRLASLFVVNAPPLVRAVANAIIQMLKPATREKVRFECTKYVEVLAKSFGGVAVVPAVLGGACSCATCVALDESASVNASVTDSSEDRQTEYHGPVLEGTVHDAVISVRYPHLDVLRVIILGLVFLWILVAMVSGRY